MTKKILAEKKQKVLEYFLICCILIGVILHFVPYIYNRSLWVDEAMLVSSICTRSLNELIASPLEWGQSAPVGWLFMVKLLTLLFGTSETVLRIWSFVTSIACIVTLYFLMRGRIRKNYALFFTAIFSLTDRYIYYGNEAKPYMSDNLCCLLALLIWQKYKEKKISFMQVIVIYSILIWFSFSAVFFVAACMIIECIRIIKEATKSGRMGQCLVGLSKCAIVMASFVFNYVLWLAKTQGNAGAADYWDLLKFPLIPASLSDLKLILNMVWEFLAFYPTYIALFICLLTSLYVLYVIKKKQDTSLILLPSAVSLIILFVASYCGFYPIVARLVQVYMIVMLVFCCHICEVIEQSYENSDIELLDDDSWGKILYYAILCGFLGIIGMSGCKNLFSSHIYKDGSEIAESVRYLEENLSDKDLIYVFEGAIPVYTYEINYSTTYSDLFKPSTKNSHITDCKDRLPCRIGNTIWGQSLFEFDYVVPYSYEGKLNMTAVVEDASLIKNNDSVYIFTSHGEVGIQELLKELENYGAITTVVDSYNTRLYHYVKEQ